MILIVFATMNSFRSNEAYLRKLEATKARLSHFVEKTARPRKRVLFFVNLSLTAANFSAAKSNNDVSFFRGSATGRAAKVEQSSEPGPRHLHPMPS